MLKSIGRFTERFRQIDRFDDVGPALAEFARSFGFRRCAVVRFSDHIPSIFDSDPERYAAAWKYVDVFRSPRNLEMARRLVAPSRLTWLTGDRYEPGTPDHARAVELDMLDAAAVMVTYDGQPHGSVLLSGTPSLSAQDEQAIVLLSQMLFVAIDQINEKPAFLKHD